MLAVLYSCKACEVVKVEVVVRRRALHETLTHWVTQVVAARISEDHVGRSPRCTSLVMDEVYIPMSSDIGRPEEN